jgi:chromosome segregation ATPase
MTNNTKTSVLKNPTLDGNITLSGSIIQNSGNNTFYDSTFTDIECSGNILTQSLDTSLISNAEFNTLNNIDITQTIQNQLNTINTNVTNNYSSIETQITQIESNINNLQTEINNIDTTHTGNYTSLQNQINVIDTDITDLQTQVNTTNTNLNTINTNLQT